MTRIDTIKRVNRWILIFIVFIYSSLFFLNLDSPFFWDAILQVSKEGHKFFLTDFFTKPLPPQYETDLAYEGFFFPLMGFMTAVFWKILGYKLWVSHLIGYLCGLGLIYNTWLISKKMLPLKYAAWVTLILLIEPTILSQLVVSSVDIIIYFAFALSVRSVLENKKWLLTIGVFVLCNIYIRGFFLCVILFAADFYYNYWKSNEKSLNGLWKFVFPYIPGFIFLLLTAVHYFYNNSNLVGSSSEHYQMPGNGLAVIKNLAIFIVRSVEHGRFFIWILFLYVGYRLFKAKLFTRDARFLLSIFLLHLGLYVLFIFISQMPFSNRYFIPHFYLITLIMFWGIVRLELSKKLKLIIPIVVFLEVTGSLWVYPPPASNSWDCTLAHLPYYELRKECFEYMDNNKIDYKDVSAGFCLYGKRHFPELNNNDEIISQSLDNKYFIYSNISNLPDETIAELTTSGKWKNNKEFKKGFITIVLYEKK